MFSYYCKLKSCQKYYNEGAIRCGNENIFYSQKRSSAGFLTLYQNACNTHVFSVLQAFFKQKKE